MWIRGGLSNKCDSPHDLFAVCKRYQHTKFIGFVRLRFKGLMRFIEFRWIERIQKMQIQEIHMIQMYAIRFIGFRSDEVWQIQEDSNDSGDSDRRSSGAYVIQGDSDDSNDLGNSSPVDLLDSGSGKEFKPGGFSGRRWLGDLALADSTDSSESDPGLKGFRRFRPGGLMGFRGVSGFWILAVFTHRLYTQALHAQGFFV